MGISGKATGLVVGLVTIMVVMFLYGNLSPELINSANNVTASGMPLSSLFSSTGVVLILVAIGVFLGILRIALPGGKN